MIADLEINVVFVADTLEREFPAVYSGLGEILERHGIPLRTIPGTRSVWCRDSMPIQVGEGRFVQFLYEPDYLTGEYRRLRADGEIGPTLPWVTDSVRSEIVLDGGDVVAWGDRAIVTDKAFRENLGLEPPELRERLWEFLRVEQMVVIPREPYDRIGHADGMVRWLDERTIAVNDYRDVDGRFRARLHQ